MIKMIAFDLDGTLFDDHKKIMPKTKAILELAAKKGIEIVPATGRPFCGVGAQVNALQGVNYILTTNGAGVYEKATGKCIHENSMKLQEFLPMMERLEKLDVMADAFVKGDCFMHQKNYRLIEEMDASEEVKEYIRSSRTCVECLTEFLRERGDDVEKVTINFVREKDGSFRDRDKVLEIVKDYPNFLPVSGGLNNVEVTKKTATKGTCLLKLGEYLGIQQNEIMAFGDSENDAAMIEMAGIGVAMANGEEVAKQAADFITLSNTEEGIAYAIEKFIPELRMS